MRMLLLSLALLPGAALARDPVVPSPEAFTAAPATPIAVPSDKPVCQNPTAQRVDARPQPNRPQKLNELPKANVYYAVQRLEGGCDKPVLVHGFQR